jgi:hypothetical protein
MPALMLQSHTHRINHNDYADCGSANRRGGLRWKGQVSWAA